MSYIPETLRREVIENAKGCCEYCLIGQLDCLLAHEVDHIVAEKHRGKTILINLCLSCIYCNRRKGSDISSVDDETGELTWLFNPRLDRWSDHFRLNGAIVEPLTAQGRVTVFVLQMNSDYQVSRRTELLEAQSYPCPRD